MADELKVYSRVITNDKEEGVFEIESMRVIIGGQEKDYASRVETQLVFRAKKDGDLVIENGGGDDFIYIYADQLDHLKLVLETALRMRDAAVESAK